jgi:hypothetical protein
MPTIIETTATEVEDTTTDNIPWKYRAAYHTSVVSRKVLKYGAVLAAGAVLYKMFSNDDTIIVEEN